jgi:hypothetical protein
MGGAMPLERIPTDALLELVPRDRIEAIVGAVRWSVLRSPSEIQAHDLFAYNTCVTTDAHRRALLFPNRDNPLRRHYHLNSRREYAEVVGYVLDQCVVVGRTERERCVVLHLAVAADCFLHLHEIELANPGQPTKRPLGVDQRFEGLGHGIFPDVLRRVRLLAGQIGLQRVIAYAIDDARLAIFLRKGFELDTDDARILEHVRSCRSQYPIRIAPLRAPDGSEITAGSDLP